MTAKLPCHVCFLDGLNVRHGIAIAVNNGVFEVQCVAQRLHVWQEDVFFSTSGAQQALHKIID